jgi:hypothetical protein
VEALESAFGFVWGLFSDIVTALLETLGLSGEEVGRFILLASSLALALLLGWTIYCYVKLCYAVPKGERFKAFRAIRSLPKILADMGVNGTVTTVDSQGRKRTRETRARLRSGTVSRYEGGCQVKLRRPKNYVGKLTSVNDEEVAKSLKNSVLGKADVTVKVEPAGSNVLVKLAWFDPLGDSREVAE